MISFLITRRQFYRLNKIIYILSLRGLGMLNSQNYLISGEKYFLKIFLKQFNKPVIFDVGSNQGTYAKMIKIKRQDADVYAFEPHPDTFKRLRKIAHLFSFKAFNCAVSDKNSNGLLYDFMKDGSTHASLEKEVIEKIHRRKTIASRIDIISLDYFTERQSISHINLLKMDTEGNELGVLLGCKKMLKENRIDVIQFEFGETNIPNRIFLIDFIELLPNYNFYRLIMNGLLPIEKYAPVHWEIFAFQNIIAINKGINFVV